MGKIYIWNNGGSDSDFQPHANVDMDDVQEYSSNQHSGGIVVLADSFEEACKLAVKNLNQGGKYHETERQDGLKHLLTTSPKVLNTDEKGLVLYASGDC